MEFEGVFFIIDIDLLILIGLLVIGGVGLLWFLYSRRKRSPR